MAAGQRKRTKKTSQGIHGGGGKGRPLTGVEKINMGEGLLRVVAERRPAVPPNVETAKRGMQAIAKAVA